MILQVVAGRGDYFVAMDASVEMQWKSSPDRARVGRVPLSLAAKKTPLYSRTSPHAPSSQKKILLYTIQAVASRWKGPHDSSGPAPMPVSSSVRAIKAADNGHARRNKRATPSATVVGEKIRDHTSMAPANGGKGSLTQPKGASEDVSGPRSTQIAARSSFASIVEAGYKSGRESK